MTRCSGCSSGPANPRGRAFTLVELLVVISVIGVLVTMLIPAVNLARESSRKSSCQNNLRQLGLGLSIHADQAKGNFCTGAFDWQRDGAVTEVGWVADLVNQGIPVGKMLCASNPAQLAETYQDLLTLPPAPDPCVNRLGNEPKILPDGSEQINPCRQIVTQGLEPNSDVRRSLVDSQVLRKFYNTNYTASWLLVRSRPRIDSSGNVVSGQPGCSTSLLSRSATAGPLNQAMLDTSNIPASIVPFLGCGNSVGTLNQDVGEYSVGTFLAQSFTVGPIQVTNGQKPAFSAGTDRGGPSGWWAVWTKQVRQDYRGFAPVHRQTCNLLMADSSVRAFQDENGDGFLNNGFLAETGTTPGMELPEEEVFSGAALRGL